MTDKITGGSRQQRIARAMVAHGQMSLQDLRKVVHRPLYADIQGLAAEGYIEPAGMAPVRGACRFKEVPVYKITTAGVAFAARELSPKLRGPGKKPPKPRLKRMDTFNCRTVTKATTKLTPKQAIEVTVTEQTKFTKYEPKFTYQTYQQPKNFMECVR